MGSRGSHSIESASFRIGCFQPLPSLSSRLFSRPLNSKGGRSALPSTTLSSNALRTDTAPESITRRSHPYPSLDSSPSCQSRKCVVLNPPWPNLANWCVSTTSAPTKLSILACNPFVSVSGLRHVGLCRRLFASTLFLYRATGNPALSNQLTSYTYGSLEKAFTEGPVSTSRMPIYSWHCSPCTTRRECHWALCFVSLHMPSSLHASR